MRTRCLLGSARGEGGETAIESTAALFREAKRMKDDEEGMLDPKSPKETKMDLTEAFDHAERLLKLLSWPYFRRVWVVQEIGMGG